MYGSGSKKACTRFIHGLHLSTRRSCYFCASHWRNNKDNNNSMSKVTAEDYREYGHYLCHERFVTNLAFKQQQAY